MRNKIFRLVIVAALMSVAVCGCQKAPESSSNGDILHAKGSVENEVEAIVNEGGTGKEENTLKEINCTIGTEDNAIRIQAQMPNMPENIYNMVLGENDTLTKDLLKDFLGSNSGTIDDLSEEVKKEREKLEVENEQSDERALFSVFGNDSVYELSDGQKSASFSNGTSAYYEDEILREKCISAYKSGSETVLNQVDHKDDYRKMEELLLDKLSKIDLTEIYIYKITSYQNESVTFYEVKFTPSYEGMGVVHEFGSVVYGEVQPLGDAWVCEDDIVTLSLDSSLGKVDFVVCHVCKVTCLSVAEDKIFYSVEACEVLAVSNGIVNVVCGQLVFFSFTTQLQVFVQLHVAFKLLLVKRPGVGMWVERIVAGSSEEESLGELPPFT